MAHVDLEIELVRSGDEVTLFLRREEPERTPVRYPSGSIRLDLAPLRSQPDAARYGRELFSMLFADSKARAFVAETRARADAGTYPLRIRIVVDPLDPMFNRIQWECLADPEGDECFAILTNTSVTRLVAGGTERPLERNAMRPLRALIAVAAPLDLETAWELPLIDRQLEVTRFRRAISPIECIDLSANGPVSLSRLEDELRKGYDIACIIAHGRETRDEVRVLLETDSREGVLVSTALLGRCFEGGTAPRLAIFSSCHSGGSLRGIEESPSRTTIGIELARAGVPVVVGIGGSVSSAAATEFVLAFVGSLIRTLDVDLAANEGRRAVRRESLAAGRAEEWPAITVFSRLKDGDIRWAPGSLRAGRTVEFERWDDLAADIANQRCTPVLGRGLLDVLVGPLRDAALDIGMRHDFPFVEQRTSLPHIARFLDTTLGRTGLIEQLGAKLRDNLLRQASIDRVELDDTAPLEQLVRAYSRKRSERSTDANQVLARLGSAVYITTNPFECLTEALLAAGRTPCVEHARWSDTVIGPPPIWEQDRDFRPTPERPLVYHLFGRWSHSESLVLTEDDLLEFVIGARAGERIFPNQLRAHLTDSKLLFLGFGLEELEFRVAYRSLLGFIAKTREGEELLHVAAQVAPDPTWTAHPAVAKQYIASYFDRSAVTILWGDVPMVVERLSTFFNRSDHAGN
jgi:hypothetical protein